LQATQSSWSSLSRLIHLSSIVSANECVGKQGAHSEWAKGTALLQALSWTEGQNPQKGSRARCGCYSWLYAKKLPDCWVMGVVNLKLVLEVGGASTAWRSSKIRSRKVWWRLTYLWKFLSSKVSSHTVRSLQLSATVWRLLLPLDSVLFTLRICRVELCTVLFYAIIPTLFLCFLLICYPYILLHF